MQIYDQNEERHQKLTKHSSEKKKKKKTGKDILIQKTQFPNRKRQSQTLKRNLINKRINQFENNYPNPNERNPIFTSLTEFPDRNRWQS